LPLTGTTVDDAARRAEPAATEGTTVGRVRRALGHDRRRPTTGGGRRRIPGTTGGGRRRIPGTTGGGRRRTPGTTGGGRRSNAGHAGCREARGASRGNTGRCPVKHRVFPQLALRASRQRQQRTGHPCPLPGYDGRRPTPHPGHDGRRTARARRAETVATLVFRVRAEDFCRCDRGGPASSCGFPETEISWRTTAPHTATHPKAP
jgi:hypothetical protein